MKATRGKRQKKQEPRGVRLLVLLAIFVIAVLFICVAITKNIDDKTMRLVTWVIGIVLIYWAISSVKIVDADESALLIFMGIITALRNSGLCFVPKGLARLEIFPTTVFEIDVVSAEVVTKRGIYRPQGVPKDRPEDKIENCEQDKAMFDATLYLSFPYDSFDDLAMAFKAKVPRTGEGLKKWIDTSIIAAFAEVGSTMTFREFTMKRRIVCKKAAGILKEGLFAMTGFKVSTLDEGETSRETVKSVPGSVLILLKKTEPSQGLQTALQRVNIEMTQRLSALSDAEEISRKAAGTFVLGIQEAYNISKIEAATMIQKDPVLAASLIETLVNAIEVRFAGDNGKVIRVDVGGAGSGGGADGGNSLTDAIIKGIATLDGMNACEFKKRLDKLGLGSAKKSKSDDDTGLPKDWQKKMGITKEDETDEEDAQEEEEEEEETV